MGQRALIAVHAVAIALLAAVLVVGVPVLAFVRAAGSGSRLLRRGSR